jgi:hypothetical protein
MKLGRPVNAEIVLHYNAVSPLNRLRRAHLLGNDEIGAKSQSDSFCSRLPLDRKEWQRVISKVDSDGADGQIEVEGNEKGILRISRLTASYVKQEIRELLHSERRTVDLKVQTVDDKPNQRRPVRKWCHKDEVRIHALDVR